MRGGEYEKWVQTIKPGDIVLLLDNVSQESNPVIFLCWNGTSEIAGKRSQYLHIPHNDHAWWFSGYREGNTSEEIEDRIDVSWKRRLDDLSKKGDKILYNSAVIAHAEVRYFPFPIKFLNKNQIKYIKIINKLKGYEY
jgi:hypothetical protein